MNDLARRGFEAAGERYDRGRPDYPGEAMHWLAERLGIEPGVRVLDLGAGTGKLATQVAATGASVVAVEPAGAMREQFRRRLLDVELLDGTAESIPLSSDSVHAVVVGQAFHWFDGPAALREIHRVLMPGGGLGLVWNVRDERVAWVALLTTIIDRLDPGAPHYHREEWRAAFESKEGLRRFGPLDHRSFTHEQVGDVETLLDRVASISYVAAAPLAAREQVLRDVRALLESSAVPRRDDALISLPYLTETFVAFALDPGPRVAAMVGCVVQVNVSKGGVPKLPVDSAWVDRLGLVGDGHTEPEPMHGGPDQAVCIYSMEAIQRVAADGHRAFPGAFGENLTLEGIELGGLAAGDRLEIGAGGLVLELTKHAGPCQTIAHWFVDRRIARISPKARPEDARWYARVLSEGRVAAGDHVEVARDRD